METTLFQILVQGIGAIGIIASILSFQCKEHKKLLIFKTANEFFFAIQYLLLGAYTGVAMNIIGCTRNLIFTKMVEKKKSTVLMRVIFSVIFMAFTVFTWSGLKSVLAGGAKVLSTVAYGSSNTAFVRCLILITSLAWFIYNFAVGSYSGCVNEFLTICSIIVGIVRLDIPKAKNKIKEKI